MPKTIAQSLSAQADSVDTVDKTDRAAAVDSNRQPSSSPGAAIQRKIIHVDCDCFFAAIEMRDDPSLRELPIAIGGSATGRGVISTCNYPARAYGIHSAMAAATAMKRCPDLILLPHNMEKYRAAASRIRAIFEDYSDLVEPLSMDEAFLDVSGCDNATAIAETIRARIEAEVGITVSAGVAPNKFLAKIGSDWNKPNGLCVIPPQRVDRFVEQLPINKLFGVGKVTAKKLHDLGVQTCGDLRAFSVYELTERFGSFGQRLFDLARGIDNRSVNSDRRRKSLSVERTFAADLPALEDCSKQWPELFARLESRLDTVGVNAASSSCPQAGAQNYQVKKQFVKIKFSNFQTTTMECIANKGVDKAVFADLFARSMQRGNGLAVRLLGLGVRFNDESPSFTQLPLFSEPLV